MCVFSSNADYRLAQKSKKGKYENTTPALLMSYLPEFHNQLNLIQQSKIFCALAVSYFALPVSGWWFDACGPSNLNGMFYSAGQNHGKLNGIKWHYFKGPSYSLRSTTMMIRPLDFWRNSAVGPGEARLAPPSAAALSRSEGKSEGLRKQRVGMVESRFAVTP